MSEETNDGTWSGLKKTLIGTISTAVLAGGPQKPPMRP